ncbi:MAG: hypothetical protein GY795_25280 [Desulfobacterales bacterium]|nr:hypothetical protein [Desulfobacterales bacterium]
METENKSIRKIKKYANRKYYDTIEKRYVSLDKLAELIKAGDDILIEENETGEDLTAQTLAQILAREDSNEAQSGNLIQLIRKGRGTVMGYAKKYSSLWQNALTMAEDEIDKLVNVLVKSKELTESEGTKLKTEIMTQTDSFKTWLNDKVDQSVKEALDMMNLATKDQVTSLTTRIEELAEAVEKLEKKHADKADDNAEQTPEDNNAEKE